MPGEDSKVLIEKSITRNRNMTQIEVTNADVQSVMQSNPLVALQVENAALKRKQEETKTAFEAAMMENERFKIAIKVLEDSESDTEVEEK